MNKKKSKDNLYNLWENHKLHSFFCLLIILKKKKKHCLQGHHEHQQHQLSQLDQFHPVTKEKE